MLPFLLCLMLDPEPKGLEIKHTLADFNKCGQASCKVEKKDYGEVRKTLKRYGFRILLKSSGDNILIAWDKPLTKNHLTRLQSIKGISQVEPDFPRNIHIEKILKMPIEVKD